MGAVHPGRVRLFVAVWPSPEVVALLHSLPRPASRPGADLIRWTGPEQWHVTLRFLGEVSDAVVGEVEAVLAQVAARLAPALAVLGPATACFGNSVLMVPVSGLERLAAATAEATATFGSDPGERRPFVGHLTLARSRRRRLGPLAGQALAASWTAYDLTLVRSTTSPTGARYDVLARFTLSG